MTIPKSWLIGAAVVIVLVLSFCGYEALQAHDAQLKADNKSEALKPALEAAQKIADQAQKTIESAQRDKAQTDSDLKEQLAEIKRQRAVPVTPQQAASFANTLPNLPQPIQVQNVPATATTPATQNLVVPQADIPALQDYKFNCDETGKRLDACNREAGSNAIIQLQTEVKLSSKTDELKAMTKDRDNWKVTAKSGTFWQRTGQGLKHSGCGMAGGGAGVKTAQGSTPLNGVIAGASTTAACELTFWLIGRAKK